MGLQQNGSKYFVRSSQTNSGGVSIGQNSTFLKQDQVVYKIKWNHECSNRMANILPTKHTHDPPPCFITVLGTKGQISTFSVHGHVAYQIKGNQVCSNMIANILPTDPTSLTLEIGSIGQISTFSEHGNVAYQIKGNQVCSNMVVSI